MTASQHMVQANGLRFRTMVDGPATGEMAILLHGFPEGAESWTRQVEALASEKNCSVSQLALAWCKDQPGITSPIIGPRTMGHLLDNLGAANVTITDEDRQTLDAISEPEGVIVSYYNGRAMDFKAPQYRW